MTAADELADLEANYHEQPAHAQPADLARINALRADLGRLPVDARLRPVAPPVAGHAPARVAEAVACVAEGARLYAAYQAREAALAPHREYARLVAAATAGSGRTPVKPLATMGTGGGPLRCDHCGLPIVLEGGDYHGQYADAAWAARAGRAPTLADRLHADEDGPTLDRWLSYVKGGMVVDVEVNGTLRIFHGYQGHPQDCLAKADRERQARRDQVGPPPAEAKRAAHAFLKHQFPALKDIERGRLVGDIVEATYGFDPGLGTNRPGG